MEYFMLDRIHCNVLQMILLSDGSISYKIWKNPPYTVYITVYIFNVTNTDAFLSGQEKLRFEEIGPYVFQ